MEQHDSNGVSVLLSSSFHEPLPLSTYTLEEVGTFISKP